ncbi:imm11 family protein [Lysinibacillus sp. RS5]|uniref:imm11 family protein n=1 Tax=unclassified Lysinibacillus TaxID=2636778 RepID=UPI0035BE8D78
MKYYRLVEFYKRDVYFYQDDQKNQVKSYELESGVSSFSIESIYYKVDKLDKYVNKYDLLPSVGAPLVSLKMKCFLEEIANNACEFFPAIIVDEKGEMNTDFFALNILAVSDCFDEQKSEYDMTANDPKKIGRITSIYFNYQKLGQEHIYRMSIRPSMIVVSEAFVEEYRKNKLKGLLFAKEGSRLRPEFLD